MSTFRWILSSLSMALLLSACAGPSLSPPPQEGAGAPAVHPNSISPDDGGQGTNQPPSRQGDLLFVDDFTGGQPQLEWVPFPFFNQDNLRGGVDATSPTGEEGVGILTNENAGGFAAMSYVDQSLTDFRLETWLYAEVTGMERGPLNGVAFRIDPVENRYYRFAAHFVSEPSLSLAYVGQDVQNFPVFLGRWAGDQIPGGPPRESGWHRLAVEVTGDKAEIYWDSQKLEGGPFALDRIPSGRVGVYATVTGGLGLAQTKVDAFAVSHSVSQPAP